MTETAKGLKGVIAGETKITLVDYEKSKLYYRGYDIEELVEYSSFEEVFWLLVKGELPGERGLAWLKQELAEHRRNLYEYDKRLLLDHFVVQHPLAVLAEFINHRGALAAPPQSPKELPYRALVAGEQLLALFPVIAAHLCEWGPHPPRFQWPYPFVKAHPGLNTAGNFLWILRATERQRNRGDGTKESYLAGEYPTAEEERALDQALILHADHGAFNVSTFSLRVTASANGDPYAAFASAVCGLSGPNHGGANWEVMRMFSQFKTPNEAEKWVVEQLCKKEHIYGFGHRLYKKEDPRVKILKGLAEKFCRKKGLPWYDIACAIDETATAIFKKRGQELPPNVDFYSPAFFAALGIPAPCMPLLFAMGRIAGWTANLIEQYNDNMLMRPLDKYVGPPPRPFPRRTL